MSPGLTPFTPLKLLAHAERVEAMLAGQDTYPVSVELDLSNSCPHDCPMCSFGTSESQGYRQQNWVQFPTPKAMDLLQQLADCGVKSVTFTGGGEPLVHRAAAALFEQAVRVGLAFGVVTNGVLLRGAAQDVIAKHATFVRVSLDAGTSDTHQITHRVKRPEFHTILDNLRHTREKAGARLTIGASFCVQQVNYREIYQAAQLVKEHGANYLEIRPTFPTEWRGDTWTELLSESDIAAAKTEIDHARLHLQDDTFQVIGMVERFDSLSTPEKAYGQCRIGPLMTVIGAEQSIWHCCVQRGNEFFKVGDLKDRSFQDAWKDVLARRMSDTIDVSKCPRCRYDGFNRLIEHGFIGNALHREFV